MGKAKLKEEEKPSSSTPKDKLYSMMKTMEKLMDRLALENTSAPLVQQGPQFRNPKFRRPQNQQRPTENRNQQPNPPVRPPFQQNLVDEEDDPKIPEESIHFLDEEMSGIFLTKEEHVESDLVYQGKEPSDYLKGYQHAIFEMQKQYNLRNINVLIIANKAQPKKDVSKVAKGKKDSPLGRKDTQLPPPIKEPEKSVCGFNLENEISNIKISVPFSEILKVNQYRSKIEEMLNLQLGAADILNVQEENPTIYIWVQGQKMIKMNNFLLSM